VGLDGPQPPASPTLLRRFVGLEADELAILCRPAGRSTDVAGQADTVYRALAEALSTHQASLQHLTRETIFLKDIRGDLATVLDIRARTLREAGHRGAPLLPAFIQQAPVDTGASLELLAGAVVPRRRDSWAVRDARAAPSCTCEGCARSGGRLVQLGAHRSFHSTNLYGAGGNTYEQVLAMFGEAERLLKQCGMGFGNVTRTWIHLSNIDRDYDILNRARREFFQERGIGIRPASTGVQGLPLPEGHDVSLSIEAIQSSPAVDIQIMSTPTLNEAWSYGADFSRGLRLVDANKVTLSISGTASLDEAGRSVHVGDFESQAERMLRNIETLLTQHDASFDDLVSAVTYLKHPTDAPLLRSIFRERGFDHFPCAIVEAPLCRPELLCETEAVAALPLPAAGV